MQELYKYELNPAVVQYILRAVNAQQIRGEQQAKDLVLVLDTLRAPKNAEELEKKTLENLKAKYEPVTEAESKPE